MSPRDVTIEIPGKFTLWEALHIKFVIQAIFEGKKIIIQEKEYKDEK